MATAGENAVRHSRQVGWGATFDLREEMSSSNVWDIEGRDCVAGSDNGDYRLGCSVTLPKKKQDDVAQSNRKKMPGTRYEAGSDVPKSGSISGLTNGDCRQAAV